MYKLMFFILLFSLSGSALAEREPWYFSFAFGLANHKHADELDQVFDGAEDVPGVDRFEFAMDLLGFHWPLPEQNTTLGFVINASSDNLSEDGQYDVALNTYLYGVSGIHYFGKEIGDGLFVRGDFGFSRGVLIVDGDEEDSDTGTGFLLGTGFAVPVSDRTRVFLGINISERKIDGDTFKTTQFTIGGLW